MKIYRHLIPVLSLLLLLLVIPVISGCSHKDRSDAKEVVKSELDQLKNRTPKPSKNISPIKNFFRTLRRIPGFQTKSKKYFPFFSRNLITKFWISASTTRKKLPRHPCGLLRLMPRLLLRILPLPCYRQKLLRLLRHSQEIPKILPIL